MVVLDSLFAWLEVSLIMELLFLIAGLPCLVLVPGLTAGLPRLVQVPGLASQSCVDGRVSLEVGMGILSLELQGFTLVLKSLTLGVPSLR